jgi:hypothetical protein
MPRIPVRTLLAAIAAVALFGALAALRDRSGALRGDEGSYVAMAASLARDGDLLFGAADEAWARARPERPAALILERTPRGVAYSKPILYPLLAAPFYAVAGDAGFWLFHLLVVGVALTLARAALARRAGGDAAWPTVLLFAAASTVVPYFAWRMTESLQVALATAGLALALSGELGPAPAAPSGWAERRLASPAAPWVGTALLGLLAALREPNAAVAAVPLLAVAAAGRLRRAAALAVTAAAAYGAVVLLTWALTGAPNPYKAPRATFNGDTGYPASAAAAAMARFETPEYLATSSLGAVPVWTPRRSAYAAFYFLVGRHSGLLAYFPAALALLAAAFAASDRAGRAALAGFAATAGFYLLYWPANYFGGETFVGNRYLMAAYPCLLFAPARLPSRRARAIAWAIGFVAAGSALVSMATARERDRGSQSQSHAHAGLFRLLPYESTASHIEGRRDRYWAGDFVRFVDPFAAVDRAHFELVAGAPAAELEIATSWSGSPLRLMVTSTAPDAVLELSDWFERDAIRLAPRAGGSGGSVEWRPSPAWRRHPFWWPSGDVPYATRLVRFRLTSATPGATARVRYLGREGVPAKGFEREVARVELPAAVAAGARTAIPVEVDHRGGWTWSSQATLPVYLGASLVALEGDGRWEFRAPLPAAVAPGERLATTIEIDWPPRPGRYRLTVDLVLEEVAWFAERVGAPLAEGEVTVAPASPAAADPPAPPRR